MGEMSNNFKKAMSEMFGLGADKTAEPVNPPTLEEDNPTVRAVEEAMKMPKKPNFAAAPAKVEPVCPAQKVADGSSEKPIGMPNLTPDERKFWDETPYRAPEIEQIDETYISKDTVIIGNIQSGSNLRIKGKVAGNIECDHNIMLSGKVEGNLSACDALVDGGQIVGNVDMRGDLRIQRDARVRGDLHCNNLDLDSAVTGDLRALHKAVFHPNAAMVGNIATQTFVVEEGAMIEGYVSMREQQEKVARPTFKSENDDK